MGNLTESANCGAIEFTRAEQDAFSARSHQLAAAAWKNGLFDDEVVPVEIPSARATRSSSTPTRASGATPPPSRSRPCVRRSPKRHHHRRVRIPDLRRGLRRRRHEQGQGRGAGLSWLAGDRCPRRRRRPGLDPADPALAGRRQGVRQGGHRPWDLDLLELNEGLRRRRAGRGQATRRRRRKINVNGGAIAMGHQSGCPGRASSCTWPTS